MTKKQSFIKMVEELLETPVNVDSVDYNYEDAMTYFESLKTTKEKEKTAFTENGKKILIFMQENKNEKNNLFKSKEIAEGLFVGARSVNGSIRKLVTDGYVEKIGESPFSYSLTDLGESISFSN